MLHISGKMLMLKYRDCRLENWEGTLEIEFWELIKQLKAQGYITDFKINGMYVDNSTNMQII